MQGRPKLPDGTQCWLAVTTTDFSRQLLGWEPLPTPPTSTSPVPAAEQALPPQTPEYLAKMTDALWQALQEDLKQLMGGRPLPQPTFLQAHRWGSAHVAPALGGTHWADRAIGAAACGDTFTGPGFENAIGSGVAAADALVG